MSPVPTAIREQNGVRPVPGQPFPIPESFLSMAKEIVVDWQLPADSERKS
jgi:hypothetical protein